MSYSIDAITQDCYEGTTCLINKLGITDENVLKEIEGAITFAKASELENSPIEGSFDFEHYKAIHKFLFEDLYNWAGQIRTVDFSKKGTVFASAEQIDELAQSCFRRLRDNNFFRSDSFDDFVDDIVDFYCVTNMLHPFREGNGRTQRIFIAQLVRLNGYDINFSDIDPDELVIATIQSANGVKDFIRNIFYENIFTAHNFEMTMQ